MCPAAQGDADPPCLPLRGRWQREALAEGEIPHGFLSPSRLRRQPPPRGGLAARHCRADGTSYPKGICSAALHCGPPSPTFVIRQARLPLRRGAMPTSPRRGKSHSGGGARGSRPTGCMCPGGQGRPPCWNIYRYPCGRAPRHPPWQRAASRDSASRKAVEAQSFEPEKTGKPVARGTGQREIIADAREEVLKRSFKRRFW